MTTLFLPIDVCRTRLLRLLVLAAIIIGAISAACKGHNKGRNHTQKEHVTSSSLDDTACKFLEQMRPLMGTMVRIQIVVVSSHTGTQAIEEAFAELKRIEELAHPSGEHSVIRKINEAAGRNPVVVPQDICRILKTALEVSERSKGAFDVTVAPLGRLWDLSRPESLPPSSEELAKVRSLVNWQDLTVDEVSSTVFLKRAGMAVGLGAIAKGYAVDSAMAVLRRHHILGAIVDAGGDMSLFGSKCGEPWTVGIQHPRKPHGVLYGIIELRQDMAVATSGDYERGLVRNGVRYHHILDPTTGEPGRRCQSVTVIGPSCTLADALATAVFVLGPASGIEMIKAHYPDYDAYILDADMNVHSTAHFFAATSFKKIESAE